MTIQLKDVNKIEFWTATAIYAFAILLLLDGAEGNAPRRMTHRFEEAGVKFSYFSSYFVPELLRYSLMYLSFLLINYCVVPSMIARKDIAWNIVLIVGLFLFVTLATGISYTYSRAWAFSKFDSEDETYSDLFFRAFQYSTWLILIIGLYACLRRLIIYFIENKDRDQAGSYQMKLDIAIGIAIWFAVFLLWIADSGDPEVIVCMTFVILSATGLVAYSVHQIIPALKKNGRKFKHFFWQMFVMSVIVWLPLGLIAVLLTGRIELAFILLVFHVPTQLIIAAPLSWLIHKKRNENTAQIRLLKKELGKSDASLSFLKSQINPHFLFNALNTLYGTALQEKAERTGEGIQKLGDMMRFMLQENVQDKIALSRDIEYLNNYIDLQKLRTSTSSQIDIKTQIDDQPNMFQITPMLLIPFVENAFKHGISLQHPSHIRVTLQIKENTLFFDVHNSIHQKTDNDPEKLKSGIGLQNVRQRLALLYPGKHELMVRESAKDFFIHLTLQLS